MRFPIWPTYIYSFLHWCSDSEDDIFEGIEISEDIKTALVSYVKRRLAPQPVKIRADIEVTCFVYEGIDAIKDALQDGENSGHPDAPVRIKLIAPPMYVLTCMTLDKELGVESLNKAIDAISSTIKQRGCVRSHCSKLNMSSFFILYYQWGVGS